MDKNKIVLRDTKDAGGSRYLAASIEPNGDLLFTGQDLGPAVQEILGPYEYEWSWRIAEADIALLEKALNASTDLLAAIYEKFGGDQAGGVKSFLDDNDIPHQAWSRLGE